MLKEALSLHLASTGATAVSRGGRSAESLVSDAVGDFRWLAENIPCQTACPAGTDIPGYLEAIYHEDFAAAYEINLRDNVFPAVLGRVCSRPCENACRHGREGNGDPVAICFSKRSAADFLQRPPVVLPPLFAPSGNKVAIVGAGPAGLAAARELARYGHRVTVLEKHRAPGGMMNQGIPAFRLPRLLIECEIGQIAAMGVDIRCGVAVGTDVTLAELREEFDAVVMAAGTLRPNGLRLPNEELPGIEHGLRYLLDVNELERRETGRRTVVIGGGYTAMDCARTAVRLGAETRVHYRRGREDMVVLPGELEELGEEGGFVDLNCSPTAFVGDGRRVKAMRFIRTRRGEVGEDGRRKPLAIAGSEFEVAVDSVILAIGQFPDTSWIDASLRADLVAADQWLASGSSASTSVEGLFVAGDFGLGATTLIQAIGHAKRCARAVDSYLTGEARLCDVARIGPVFQSKVRNGRTTGRTKEMNRIPIHAVPTLPAGERTLTAEVELGYPRPVAVEAAARCYLCHYKFEILDEKCVLCDECIRVKPVKGCIVEISSLRSDGDGITGYEPLSQGNAPSLYYSRLWIDQNQCIRCGACEAACPVNAITIQKVSLETQACHR